MSLDEQCQSPAASAASPYLNRPLRTLDEVLREKMPKPGAVRTDAPRRPPDARADRITDGCGLTPGRRSPRYRE
jgi:hypothetical protein